MRRRPHQLSHEVPNAPDGAARRSQGQITHVEDVEKSIVVPAQDTYEAVEYQGDGRYYL